MSATSFEWWGFSPAHGWVVLDKSLPENKARSGVWLFFRCRDATFFRLPDQEWRQPAFMHAPLFISRLSEENKDAGLALLRTAEAQFGMVAEKYEERRAEEARAAAELKEKQAALVEATNLIAAAENERLRRQWAARQPELDVEEKLRLVAAFPAARDKYFLGLGRPNPGTRRGFAPSYIRTPNCYHCGRQIDNVTHELCNACNWIVCLCGACKCGSSWEY